MRIGDWEFMFASTIGGRSDSAGNLELFWPHLRYSKAPTAKLLEFGEGPFSKLVIGRLPSSPGVYAVTDPDGDALYVGLARDSLRDRWGGVNYGNISPRNCYVGGQATNVRVNYLITKNLIAGRSLNLWILPTDQSVSIEYVLIAVSIEYVLIDSIQPLWNRRGIRGRRNL